MKPVVYLLISEDTHKTYIGSTDDIARRLKEHRKGIVSSTRSFGRFKYYILENTVNIEMVRKREKYWKSTTGRRKLKKIFNEIKNINGPIV